MWVRVYLGFVMCGCECVCVCFVFCVRFDNCWGVLLICILVFAVFRIFSMYIYTCFVCTSVRSTDTE